MMESWPEKKDNPELHRIELLLSRQSASFLFLFLVEMMFSIQGTNETHNNPKPFKANTK